MNSHAGTHIVAPQIIFAPMEGVIDAPMRALFSEIGGFDRFVCEFIRVSDRLLPDHVFFKYCPELLTQGQTKEGIPVYVQLLGGRPEIIAENASRIGELGAPGIDLNFGCPAKTVNRHDGGASLLKNPHRLFDVITAVRKSVGDKIPVTAKVRLGFSDKSLCLEIAQAVDTAGAKNLVVHARTRDEGYRPPAHWEFIAQMKSVIKQTHLFANGDIWTLEDYLRCREITGCKDVALGRGAVATPHLARQIKSYYKNTNAESSAIELKMDWHKISTEILPQFISLTTAYKDEGYTVARIKQWTRLLSRQYSEADILFNNIKTFKSLSEMQPHLIQN
jgi:tRNA-dihydrouridine synthase C